MLTRSIWGEKHKEPSKNADNQMGRHCKYAVVIVNSIRTLSSLEASIYSRTRFKWPVTFPST